MASVVGTLIIIGIFVLIMVAGARSDKAWAAQPPNPHIVCPHCSTKGVVKTRTVQRKKGISGGKATGAVLTGGLSAAATGLSRKETATEMTCTNCGVVWDVV